jgi:uncharacterized membrane protein
VLFLAALLFGIVAGLRTFTGEAVYFGLRGGIAGIAFPVLAIVEYAGDVLPNVPARTTVFPLTARILSGAFMGWIAARVPGAILGIIGAFAGAFGGYRVRIAAIARFGALPAAIGEDVTAIAIAFAAVAAAR